MTPTDKRPEFHVRVTEHATIITLDGEKVASAWGPACASTDWFACRRGEDPQRFPSRAEAELHAYVVLNMPPAKLAGGEITGEPREVTQTERLLRKLCDEQWIEFDAGSLGIRRFVRVDEVEAILGAHDAR